MTQKLLHLSLQKYALKSNDNIVWITGGQPKKNDKINNEKYVDLKKNLINILLKLTGMLLSIFLNFIKYKK